MQRQRLGAASVERDGFAWVEVSPSSSKSRSSVTDRVSDRFRRLNVGSGNAERCAPERRESHMQMFADRFIEHRISEVPHHFGAPSLRTGKRSATVAQQQSSPSSWAALRPSRTPVGVSQIRRQSLPVKLCRPKDIQQSFPTKFSPMQPLLDKRHSLRSSPVARSSTRPSQRSRSQSLGCRRSLSEDFRYLTEALREENDARITLSLSRQVMGEDGTRRRLKNVAERLRTSTRGKSTSHGHERHSTEGGGRKGFLAGEVFCGREGARGGGRGDSGEWLMGEALSFEGKNGAIRIDAPLEYNGMAIPLLDGTR